MTHRRAHGGLINDATNGLIDHATDRRTNGKVLIEKYSLSTGALIGGLPVGSSIGSLMALVSCSPLLRKTSYLLATESDKADSKANTKKTQSSSTLPNRDFFSLAPMMVKTELKIGNVALASLNFNFPNVYNHE